MKQTITFQPHVSRIYFCYLIFVHLISFIAICLIAPIFVDVVFLLSMILSFLYFVFRPNEIRSLRYVKKAEWILLLHSREIVFAELLGSSVLMRYVVVLHFRFTNTQQKKRMILFCDHFSEIDYRSLRRCMKIAYL